MSVIFYKLLVSLSSVRAITHRIKHMHESLQKFGKYVAVMKRLPSLSSNADINSWLGPILSSPYCRSHKLFYCVKPYWGYFSYFVVATRARSHKSIHLKFTRVHGWAGTGEYAETLWTCHFHQNIKRCEWSQQRSRLCQVKTLLLLWFMRFFFSLWSFANAVYSVALKSYSYGRCRVAPLSDCIHSFHQEMPVQKSVHFIALKTGLFHLGIYE